MNDEPLHLLVLSDDVLCVVVAGAVADPLKPRQLVSFSTTCKRLRTPLQQALSKLRQQHEEAKALLTIVNSYERRSYDRLNGEKLAKAVYVKWNGIKFMPSHVSTLSQLSNRLPLLKMLLLSGNCLGSHGMQELCAGLGCGALPSLINLQLTNNEIGSAGAMAIKAALCRGALPKLRVLCLAENGIDDCGAAALAPALRKAAMLQVLNLERRRRAVRQPRRGRVRGAQEARAD